jgi:omega-amidase
MSSLTITLIQTSLHWEDKAANLSMLADKIASIDTQTEIVVLPEMFSTGFSMNPAEFAETMDGETVAWMRKNAVKKRIILTGSIIIKEDDHYHNRLIWMLPNGEYGFYDKRHLFAFASEDRFYTPGTKRLIASVKGWKINLQVCYDLRFPVWARQQSIKVVTVLRLRNMTCLFMLPTGLNVAAIRGKHYCRQEV